MIWSKTYDPLVEVLRFIFDFQLELSIAGDDSKPEITNEVVLERSVPRSRSDKSYYTCRLFALLYGQTFDWLTSAVDLSEITFRFEDDFFETDETGKRVYGPYEYVSQEDIDGTSQDENEANDGVDPILGEELNDPWAPISINISVNGVQKHNFTWSPVDLSLCSLGRLIFDDSSGGEIITSSLDDLESIARDPIDCFLDQKKCPNHQLWKNIFSYGMKCFLTFKTDGISQKYLETMPLRMRNYHRNIDRNAANYSVGAS